MDFSNQKIAEPEAVDNIEKIKITRGQKLKDLRIAKRLTADDLVEKAFENGQLGRITTSAVYAWEAGRNLLSNWVAECLAPVLECSVEDIIGTKAEQDKMQGEIRHKISRRFGRSRVKSDKRLYKQEVTVEDIEFVLSVAKGLREPLTLSIVVDLLRRRFPAESPTHTPATSASP